MLWSNPPVARTTHVFALMRVSFPEMSATTPDTVPSASRTRLVTGEPSDVSMPISSHFACKSAHMLPSLMLAVLPNTREPSMGS